MTTGIMILKKFITMAGKTTFMMGKWKMNWRELIMDTMYLNDFLKVEAIRTCNMMAAIRRVFVFSDDSFIYYT